MKAIVKKTRAPGLTLEDVPIPKIRDNEVLIKTRKNAICGTDLHIYNWDDWAQKTLSPPLVIGHEFVGEIAELGKNVTGLKVGDRVCGEGHITCGYCPLCREGKRHLCMHTKGLGVQRHGSFAEYFNLPAANIFKLPDSTPDEIAAIFDPFGNAVHTALWFNLTGEDVLITGAGPIGIMACAIARLAGAHRIVISDHNSYRLNLAKILGATHTVDISTEDLREKIKSAGINDGFTRGLEMSGHPKALEVQLENAQNGANIALLGILPNPCPVNLDLVIFKMLQIKGIYGREIFATWDKMVHLVESGLDLQPLITHRYPIDHFEEGFKIMQSGQCGKVLLEW